MPFTPFHLGPGALFKAIGGDRFSFLIFGGAQVLMDVEPLLRLIRGDTVVHGPSHTVAGALGIALLSTALGRPMSNMALRLSGIGGDPITWIVALLSAFVGTYSHLGLDAVMHGDMMPFWPFASDNWLLNRLSLAALHSICLAAGLLGGALVGIRVMRNA